MNILITGGASGLGRAMTERLAQNPEHKVYFTYSKSAEGAKSIETAFGNAVSMKCDFRNQEEVQNLATSMAGLDLDVLINNAYSGEPVKTYFHKMKSEDFLNDFQDNLLPTIQLSQAAITHFRKKKSGKLITVLTSFLLNTPPTGTAAYVAGKAYLAQLNKAWASENAKFNVSANTISPSFMLTGLTKETDERIIEQMVEGHPLKKLLTVEEVADTVAFMVAASGQMNGVDIVLNSATNLK